MIFTSRLSQTGYHNRSFHEAGRIITNQLNEITSTVFQR